jgi:hypothetical protein
MNKKEPMMIGSYEGVSIYCEICGRMDVDEEHKEYCIYRKRKEVVLMENLARAFKAGIKNK